MTLWSQNRIAGVLLIWNFLNPLKIIITSSSIFIYAGAWGYLPNNPFSDSPLIISLFYAAFMFPFTLPGIFIVSYVWNSYQKTEVSRYRYSNIVLILQVVYILLIWVLIPCPISTTAPICLPVPSTGFIALLFTSKVVKKVDVPWTENPIDTFIE